MFKNLNTLITVLLLLFQGVEKLLAESGHDVAKLQSVYLGIENGLSNNSVTSIYQDQRGFMWIGTFDGMNRYDGYDFMAFRNQPGDTTTLINNRIVSISGNDHEIWVGTKKGFSVYDYMTGKFSPGYSIHPQSKKRELVDYPVNEVKEYEGTVFVATAGKGLMFSTGKDGDCEKVPLIQDGKLSWDYHAQGIDFDSLGQAWVFIQGVGIARAKADKPELQVVFSRIKSGWCLTLDDESNLWIGLDNGLLQYNIKDGSSYIYSHEEVRYQVKDIIYLPDRQQVWAATDGNGVVCYDLNDLRFSKLNGNLNSDQIISKSVYSLCQDGERRVWVGTLRGGIEVIWNQNLIFQTVSMNKSAESTLPGNFILCFCERDWTRVWIGTDGSGASFWNFRRNTFKNYQHDPHKSTSLPGNFVTDIERTRKGTWFATYGGGVCLFNEKAETFKRYPLYDPKRNYYQNNIWVLFKDSDYDLWAASSNGNGLFRYNYSTDQFDFVDTKVNSVISMAQDQQGNLWVGTFNELVKIDKETNATEVFKMNYPVRAIVPKNKNVLLVGTEGGGLILFDPGSGKMKVLTTANGLPNNSVLNIIEDDYGLYWLSTYNGISKFDIKSGRFTNYYDSDGLQSNQFNYNAALKLSNGDILMGGIKGLNVITPNVLTQPSRFPKLLITEIKINNVPIEDSGKTAFSIHSLKLPSERSMLSIGFVGLEYTHPDKISYAYLMEGWDTDWHYSDHIRDANYSKLTEGQYTFKVKSTNADGTWNEEAISLPIVILPPWYRTTWSYLLYFVLLSGIALIVITYQKKQSRLKYEVRLSEDKMKQEKALNEKKLTFFTTMSNEFRSPLTMIINPLKEMIYGGKINPEAIEIVYRNSRRLLNLVNQLVLFRKVESESGALNIIRMDALELCKEVFVCFIRNAKSKNIEYEFLADMEKADLYGDRQKLEMCLFNLISNALKFTNRPNGKVAVTLNEDQGEFIIAVSDNGPGISSVEKDRVFDLFYQVSGNVAGANESGFGIGLFIVKNYMHQHHGIIRCFDNSEEGITFEMRLKKGKEHFAGLEIFDDPDEQGIPLGAFVDMDEEAAREEGGESDITEQTEIPARKEIFKESKEILIVDEDLHMLEYMKRIFSDHYVVRNARGAENAIKQIQEKRPDLVISDVLLHDMNGVDFCKLIKQNEETKHIPVILLTAAISEEIKLKGIEVGADDYITKPFDKDYLRARIEGIFLKERVFQDYLLKTITLNTENLKLSDLDKEFIDRIVEIIEDSGEDFSIKMMSEKLGMSYSLLYKRVKQLTQKSIIEFVRFIRLRKVAMMIVSTNIQVTEAAHQTGFNDLKYFRRHFQQLYGMTPSHFQKKYRDSLQDKQYTLND